MIKDQPDDTDMDFEDNEARLPAVHDPEVYWDSLPLAEPDPEVLARNHVISAARKHPAHAAFDMLRTRLLQALAEQGWSKVAITAPTRGCGSSFVTANLAFSVARLEATRSVVLDMDLRKPSLHETLGLQAHHSMTDYLQGLLDPEEYLLRTHSNLAFGFNNAPKNGAAELFQDTMTSDVLDELHELLSPDLMLFDLPPALEFDDVLGFLPNVDGVLVVAGGGVSTAEDITKVEQMLSEVKPLLGVMLNKAEGKLSL
ncbi:P-loop NTPase [Shimia abyssi]|uniref:Mrp family chromosome partitioning ATPase n=1 Tax=Shimia abyssi TaxID=1662395 RepID=A0A2P8FBR1_9RHOB|nr:P-loop NTPase [Shimia abyssi]PSL19181.1 Mrp family chromosome partitioning ATPase [Shimia abyssi]